MEFSFSPKVEQLRARLIEFMDAEVNPNEQRYFEELEASADRWSNPPIMETMKAKARAAGSK